MDGRIVCTSKRKASRGPYGRRDGSATNPPQRYTSKQSLALRKRAKKGRTEHASKLPSPNHFPTMVIEGTGAVMVPSVRGLLNDTGSRRIGCFGSAESRRQDWLHNSNAIVPHGTMVMIQYFIVRQYSYGLYRPCGTAAPVLAATRPVEVPVAEVLAKQQQASASSGPTAPMWRAGDRACHVGDRACYAGDRACHASCA